MVVPGLFLGASVALVTFDPLVLFSFHPTAMALGYGALMTPGAFLALKLRGAPGPALRVAGLWAHAALQTAASAACFGGLVAIVANKTIKRKPHLVSLHATLGAASLLLALCALASGAGAFRALGIWDRLPDRIKPLAKRAHRNLGFAAWVAGQAAAMTALNLPSTERHAGGTAWPNAWRAAILVSVACAASLKLHTPSLKREAEEGFAGGGGGVVSGEGRRGTP